VGAFRVNSFSTEFSNAVIQPPSAHNHNHEVQLPTLKSDPKDRYLLISEFDSLYPTPHPVAVCAGKGTKRARIEPSELNLWVYGFQGPKIRFFRAWQVKDDQVGYGFSKT
jgi:hypothetical protein